MLSPQDHNICKRYGCEVPVGDKQYLCGNHLTKLADMLDTLPEYLTALSPIELATSTPLPQQGGGGHHAGSRPPINLSAWCVWIELTQYKNTRAYDIAYKDPNAGHTYKTIASLVNQAHQILNGTPEQTTDRMEAARRIAFAYPNAMSGTEICEHFNTWGIPLTRPQLWKWVERGHLQSVGRGPDGKTQLFTVLGILTALERTRHAERQEVAQAS